MGVTLAMTPYTHCLTARYFTFCLAGKQHKFADKTVINGTIIVVDVDKVLFSTGST